MYPDAQPSRLIRISRSYPLFRSSDLRLTEAKLGRGDVQEGAGEDPIQVGLQVQRIGRFVDGGSLLGGEATLARVSLRPGDSSP